MYILEYIHFLIALYISRYSLKDDKYSNVFEVDEVSGEISTIAKLDREIQVSTYLYIYLSIYIYIYPSIYQFIYLF